MPIADRPARHEPDHLAFELGHQDRIVGVRPAPGCAARRSRPGPGRTPAAPRWAACRDRPPASCVLEPRRWPPHHSVPPGGRAVRPRGRPYAEPGDQHLTTPSESRSHAPATIRGRHWPAMLSLAPCSGRRAASARTAAERARVALGRAHRRRRHCGALAALGRAWSLAGCAEVDVEQLKICERLIPAIEAEDARIESSCAARPTRRSRTRYGSSTV